jgi:5-methylcytosine-specific restriction endonuclease McrA
MNVRRGYFVPSPKPHTFRDPKITKKAIARDGVCLYGLIYQDGCLGPLDGHHIKFRGAGGADAPENVISLCRRHHDLAQARRITSKVLRDLLTRFHGYEYGDTDD